MALYWDGKMKILVLSDLHSDFSDFTMKSGKADVVVFAGDIGNPFVSMEKMKASLGDVPAIYVPGNHEFYRRDISSTLSEMKKLSKTLKTVHVLNDESVVVSGVRFLGSILWTDYDLFGRKERTRCMSACDRYLNDHRMVTVEGKRFSPEMALDMHVKSRAWLEKELDSEFDGRTVVVTHHAPHVNSLAPRFATEIASGGFVSNLPEELIGKADAWVHGHTHSSFSYVVGKCRVVCNPRGYARGTDEHTENSAFDRRLMLNLTKSGVRLVKRGKTEAEKEVDRIIAKLTKIKPAPCGFIDVDDVDSIHFCSLMKFFAHKTRPLVDGRTDFVYEWDFKDWIAYRAREMKRALEND